MLKNYLKIAWRNISHHKLHTAINVSGLALGMTCCLFIFLWVRDEKSIDNFHAHGKDIYTLYQTVSSDGKVDGSYSLPLAYGNGRPTYLLEDLNAAVPEVKAATFYKTGYELPWGHPESFRAGEKILKMEGSRAGKDFFKVFSYPLIAGDRESVLKEIGNIALSRKMAENLFGSPAKAIGQTVRYEDRSDFVVSGVFEDLPKESSLHFDFLFSWEAQKKGILEYSSNNYGTYIQLAETADVKSTTAKINQYLQTRLQKNTGVSVRLGLQRFGDQYLQNIFVGGRPVGGRIEYVHIFSGIAIFILIIACINFMNLATARSVRRAKEIGLRKVVGSSRAQLIGQFFGEAILFSFLAMIVSVLLLLLLLPAFNLFTGKHIAPPFTAPVFWLYLTGLVFITGMVAGLYPALYLSSLQPVRVMKGTLRFTQGAIWFRKSLTVFQFVLSISLIIATIVITGQTNYVQKTHLGYDRDNLVYIRIEGALTKMKNYLLFKERASHMPGIAMVDRATEAPHAMNFLVADNINWEGKPKNASVGFKPASVGFDFVRLMKMQIVQGRDFSPLNATDSSDAFLVNEEAVREMGMKDPIGKWVSAWQKKGHIIGVLKDYHTQSLHEPIRPVMIDVKEYEDFGLIIARTQAGKTREALASLASVYKGINTNYAFDYQFVDEEYRRLYSSEQIISQLSVLFATLAILISSLGLLGLVMFAAEQRTKEIGIRKVLGASLRQIIVLFSKDFLGLIGIAFLIAAPLAWYAMNSWLHDFAYRVAISWWIFLLAGGSALLIALLTMSYQAVKAGMANPVRSLKAD